MGLILDWIACRLGRHDWLEALHHNWGENTRIRQCKRCGLRQRWWARLDDPTERRGFWINL